MPHTAADPLRALLHSALQWEDAHVSLRSALAGLPVDKRGAKAPGVPWSIWQVLDHLRRTQHDILDFCVNPAYKELTHPDDYWPPTAEPPNEAAWNECLAQIEADTAELQRIAVDPAVDLTATIPHGSGQTFGRELVLVIDHNGYHVGQIVLIRRLLGVWPA